MRRLLFALLLLVASAARAEEPIRWCETNPTSDHFSWSAPYCAGEPGQESYQCETWAFRGVHCDGYRLPTEAEWEHFARAGTTGPLYEGTLQIRGKNWGEGLDAIAVYGGNSKVDYSPAIDCSAWREMQIPADRCGPHPVAQKRPSPWGIYDVLGNVGEWTTDAYLSRLPGQAVTDPVELKGDPDGLYWHPMRGAGWDWDARWMRLANRSKERGSTRQRQFGFRPVRTVRAAEIDATKGSK